MERRKKSFLYKNYIYFGIYCIVLLFLWGKEIAWGQEENHLRFLQVSLGNNHACGISVGGTLYCWGNNNVGQLGVGDRENKYIPTPVKGTGKYIRVVVGSSYTCGIKSDLTLHCWGNNSVGQLGVGDATDRYIPTPVKGTGKYIRVVLGNSHTCGVKSDLTVHCWGMNNAGQLGVGDRENKYIPTPVKGTGKYIRVVAGDEYTCGITFDRKLYCWGSNAFLQLGVGDKDRTLVPTEVAGGGKYKDVVVSKVGLLKHTCGIRIDGSVYCWGSNGFGQLGVGDRESRNIPTLVSGKNKYTKIVIGDSRTCGITEAGELYCWGQVKRIPGDLGGKTEYLVLPTSIIGKNKKVSDVSIGNSIIETHVCALTVEGEIYCWGKGRNGQIGTGNEEYYVEKPTLVTGGKTYRTVVTGENYTCAIRTDDTLYCWGDNTYGQLGVSINVSSTKPFPVFGTGKYTLVSLGKDITCGIQVTGDLYCWGYNAKFSSGSNSSEVQNISIPGKVDVGGKYKNVGICEGDICALNEKGEIYCSWQSYTSREMDKNMNENVQFVNIGVSKPTSFVNTLGMPSKSHYCGIDIKGRLYCWGDNTYGQLGIGDTQYRGIPTLVSGGGQYTQVVLGSSMTCGIRTNGQLYCWGNNSSGILGVGEQDSTVLVPKLVKGGGNYTMVSVGRDHICGIKHDGILYCWGGNNSGKLGVGDTLVREEPTQVLGGQKYKTVYVGYNFTCGVNLMDELYCWGNNEYGQLGIGNKENKMEPTKVSGAQKFKHISVGYGYVCGITMDGKLYCWGRNVFGQLGIGGTENKAIPTLVSTGSQYINIFAGLHHACAIRNDGVLECWGNNNYGQLGDGRKLKATKPMQVTGITK